MRRGKLDEPSQGDLILTSLCIMCIPLLMVVIFGVELFIVVMDPKIGLLGIIFAVLELLEEHLLLVVIVELIGDHFPVLEVGGMGGVLSGYADGVYACFKRPSKLVTVPDLEEAHDVLAFRPDALGGVRTDRED